MNSFLCSSDSKNRPGASGTTLTFSCICLSRLEGGCSKVAKVLSQIEAIFDFWECSFELKSVAKWAQNGTFPRRVYFQTLFPLLLTTYSLRISFLFPIRLFIIPLYYFFPWG